MPWNIFISRYQHCVFFSSAGRNHVFQVKQLKDSIAQMQVPPAPLDLVETKKTEGMVHNQRLKTQMIHFTAVYIDIFILCKYMFALCQEIYDLHI